MDAIRPERLSRTAPLPPAVRAILWMDAVLVVVAILALFGMRPALGHDDAAWSWLAFAGAALTAALGSLSAFALSVAGSSRAWLLLPAPALILWASASGLGCLAAGDGAWGGALAEAARCLGFLLAILLPLLALMFYMLWRCARRIEWRATAAGALAAAAAAATLLTLVHPHASSLLDLGAHAIAIAAALGIAARAPRGKRGELAT